MGLQQTWGLRRASREVPVIVIGGCTGESGRVAGGREEENRSSHDCLRVTKIGRSGVTVGVKVPGVGVLVRVFSSVSSETIEQDATVVLEL